MNETILERILHRLHHIDDRIDGMAELVERFDECLRCVAKGVVEANSKLENLMALADELKASIDKLRVATSKVAARLTELTTQLRDTSLTAEERTLILNDIDEISTHLDAMGTDPAHPVPPEPAAMTRTLKAPKKS